MDRHEAEELLAEQAFDEESQKLADVTRHIEDSYQSLKTAMPATAAHQQTANAIQKILTECSEVFWNALKEPYFGRLDYYHRDKGDPLPDAESNGDLGKMRTIYLGGAQISGTNIFSWTAPVGSLWYTQSREGGITAPKQFIETWVELKRYLRIRDGQLEDLNDIFQRQLLAPDSAGQNVLARALSGTGADDGQLTVIIETIEPEQYESIANVSDKVLIVQGAAGSGKSEIGLHRIAFLLSPFSDIAENERPTPNTTLIVGPSQAFLENVDYVLPNLGVAAGVHRVRFSEWLGKLMSARVTVRPKIWNSLLSTGGMGDFDEQSETFKGSLGMADAMDRHVSERARETRKRCLDLDPIVGPDFVVRVTRQQVKDTLDAVLPARAAGQFLNRLRDDFISRIIRMVEQAGPLGRRLQRAQSQRQRGARDALERTRRDRSETERRRAVIRDVVESWCESAWQPIDFRQEYAALLSDADRMARLSRNALSAEDAESLAQSARSNRGGEFGDADMGALAYLDHLLNRTVERRYRHIVVDEAQDISPIEFKLLAISSSNNWFTVLGDTAQRLTPYRGIRTWKRDLNPVFGRSDIEVQPVRRTYRSTRQITTFTNRILRTFDKNIPAPIPFSRDGARVEYSRHANGSAMYRAIIEDIDRIRSMDGLDDAVVSILVRDTLNMNRFRDFCKDAGFDGIASFGEEDSAGALTILARIPDAKGLEYDAVIVMGVNDTFRDTLFNKKLLYLATTRAKHYLGIHWFGDRSPILDAVSELAVTWHRR